MGHRPAVELLVLHAVRLKGFAGTAALAARFGLDEEGTQEQLLDAQAMGRVSRTAFADQEGWSLTEAGRRHGESLLREELDEAGARASVVAVHERFVPVNARAAQLFTAWQVHADGPADTMAQLTGVAAELHALEGLLTARLARFAGYHDRFTAALSRAADDRAWITGVEVDSCHRVWFELHEDLVATLGISR